MRTRRNGLAAVAVGALAALGLVACGGGGGGSDGSDTASPRGSDPEARSRPSSPQGAVQGSAIPAVNVREIPSGSEFALGSIVPSDRPVLVWFWAPH